ncbi:MAG: acetyl/propionyl/methylcrotonyl-CoA carboxylase subunit alpha [Solirubrobacterales bacterium]
MAGALTRVLVANRGEIARRIMRGCRELGLESVAVFSEPDRDAPFVADADHAVALGGSTAAESYLRADTIIDAAHRTGADAVHPGYGFLAENAGFARACADAGLTFVGPSPEAIEAMGSKVRARDLMADAGVPIVPGAKLGADADAEAIGVAGEQVGFPVMVKASAGGGGKGMRTVTDPAALADAVAGARREAASAFGDDTVFLERALIDPRHVEIQVFADAHGTTVSLHERECSVQRRHQKVIEEAPSPVVGPKLRARMGEAAVRAAETVGYVGAGTVEFLLAGDEFFFLEMNTRLQVEHPVTEEVTGLDLVRLQLLVAAGQPLPPEAREPALRGHAVEARLYAEDPAAGYLPQTGTVHRFRPPADPALRVETGVADGSEISVHYDPMVAKMIVWAPTRAEAARRLAACLAATEIHGLVTNRDFLVRVLRHPEFLEGAIDTGFLERHPVEPPDDGSETAEGPVPLGAPLADAQARRLHAAAAAVAGQAARRSEASALAGLPSGWRNNPSADQQISFEIGDDPIEVAYRFTRDGLRLAIDGNPLDSARLHGASATEVDLEVAGIRRRYRVHHGGTETWVDSPLGSSALTERSRFGDAASDLAGGSLIAPMPGQVIDVPATVGDRVEAGDVIVILEAMKMEHELTAPEAGTLTELSVAKGDQVDPGAVLAVVEPDEA